ncbi:hypothetical protein [Stigmatella erecta]|uniref:MerC mercury resistance protein n=1 Tax=Stigmatella erecta TaxID=83460 RepID=A0A1I0KTX7_9BACT|nr:hypothetical protein [Stigmatella erecta]SEU29525.1 hypothetical protein SAMN05443639_114122 [Stigmatella erecta]
MAMNGELAQTCHCHVAAAPPAEAKGTVAERASRPMLTALLSIVLAFFPKCAVCWTAYMGMFGSVWLARTPYVAWFYPVLLGLSALNLLLLLKRAPKRGYGPVLFNLAGIAIILGGRSMFPQDRWFLFCGMALMVVTPLVNSFTADCFKAVAFLFTRKGDQS